MDPFEVAFTSQREDGKGYLVEYQEDMKEESKDHKDQYAYQHRTYMNVVEKSNFNLSKPKKGE